jgi:hypothetical protein
MSITSQQLMNVASELRSTTPELVAVGILKKAGFDEAEARYMVAQDSMEKAACSALQDKGFDPEEAVKLVKAANVDVRTLTHMSFESPAEEMAEILEKAAAQIQTLEAQLSEALAETEQVKAASAQDDSLYVEKVEVPSAITKLATSGQFTNSDLDALMSMPKDTLTKLAAAVDEPWTMGAPVGVARTQTDPLTEFLLG